MFLKRKTGSVMSAGTGIVMGIGSTVDKLNPLAWFGVSSVSVNGAAQKLT